MNREKLLSSVWVRLLVFAWMIVFPIVFIALPMIEMFFGRTEENWTPFWGLLVWLLMPWAVSIVLKYFGLTSPSENK